MLFFMQKCCIFAPFKKHMLILMLNFVKAQKRLAKDDKNKDI